MATRNIPDHYNGKNAAVVIKLDVEGKELEIMADLVMSGALEHLDNIHVDWTTDPYSQYENIETMRNAVGFITQIAKEKNLRKQMMNHLLQLWGIFHNAEQIKSKEVFKMFSKYKQKNLI